MSKIWDALQKAEETREPEETPAVLPGRVQLSAKQRSAIEALLTTDSLDEVVRLCGVKEATLRRWMAQPGFVAAYYAAGVHQLRDSLHRLRVSTGEAVEVLRKALSDEDASVRIQAAAAILRGATLGELRDTAPRLEATGVAPRAPRKNNP